MKSKKLRITAIISAVVFAVAIIIAIAVCVSKCNTTDGGDDTVPASIPVAYENLNRGLVVTRGGNKGNTAYVSWRFLVSDSEGTTFDVY